MKYGWYLPRWIAEFSRASLAEVHKNIKTDMSRERKYKDAA